MPTHHPNLFAMLHGLDLQSESHLTTPAERPFQFERLEFRPESGDSAGETSSAGKSMSPRPNRPGVPHALLTIDDIAA